LAITYLDDFSGAETREKAQDAFDTLENLSKLCGLEESVEKSVKPSTRMEFLGVTVDTEKMTLEVTPDRVRAISLLVEAWLMKKNFV
jgi:hypothetical protein